MTGHLPRRRAGKAGVIVVIVLAGIVCLILGGLCGGGLMMMLAVRPAQREVERMMAERDAVQRDAAQLGKAAGTVGDLLGSTLSKGSTEATDTKGAEAAARTVFENIRAGRPQALFKHCSMEYRQSTFPDSLAQQLAKYPLPLRTEAIGDASLTLPPIDDKTHQFRYSTTTTEGRPVTYTITLVFATPDGFSGPEWLLDQLTITEGTAERVAAPGGKSP
jgi:hypothetical protein